jgi:hypothetical protein
VRYFSGMQTETTLLDEPIAPPEPVAERLYDVEHLVDVLHRQLRWITPERIRSAIETAENLTPSCDRGVIVEQARRILLH